MENKGAFDYIYIKISYLKLKTSFNLQIFKNHYLAKKSVFPFKNVHVDDSMFSLSFQLRKTVK